MYKQEYSWVTHVSRTVNVLNKVFKKFL